MLFLLPVLVIPCSSLILLALIQSCSLDDSIIDLVNPHVIGQCLRLGLDRYTCAVGPRFQQVSFANVLITPLKVSHLGIAGGEQPEKKGIWGQVMSCVGLGHLLPVPHQLTCAVAVIAYCKPLQQGAATSHVNRLKRYSHNIMNTIDYANPLTIQ